MDTDHQLLKSYASNGSERAFRELVERHINLVHSAALRESKGNVSLAEDITQAVFTELARRATELVQHSAIAGWLYTCVRHMTANVRRAEDRRQRREQEAFTMNELLGPDPADKLWQQVRPELDDVMHELSQEDRTAVVLRFFEGRSLKEVGLALGLTENAARMRVERSLEKLRGLLSQRGVKSTASTLAAVLAAGAAMTVPSTLASTVATSALATAATGGAAAFSLAKLLSMAKTKTAAAGALVILVAAVAVWRHVRANRAITGQMAQSQTAVPAAATVVGDSAQNDSSLPAIAPTNAAASSQMALQLVETETGQPLAHAKLYLFYLLEDGRGKTVNAVTDGNGKLGVDLPQAPYRALNMFVTADGHVPKVISWGFGRAMPAEYTMKLERGVTIGGVVVDAAGQPIAGAKIELDAGGNDRALPENIQFGPDADTFTDSAGRWSCNMVPKDFDRIEFIISHPDHAETTANLRPGAPEARSSVITMKAGFRVTGAVQDSNGNPIDGANVREVRMNSEGEHSETTDASGTFELKSMKAGELTLAVQAKGLAPAVQTIQVTGSVAGLRFQLDPGQLLRGRVTDEEGNPVTNAWVETTRRAVDKVKWSTNTDTDGRFEWDSAPPDPLLYSFLAEGFNHAYALTLQADGAEHEIKLTREQPAKHNIQITGTAVDADTGQPLDDFKVLKSDLDPNWAFPFEFGTTGKDGRFSWSFPAKSTHPGYQLQIETEGYLPAVSVNLQKKDGSQTFEFKLQRGSGPSGAVLLPSGEPAANATVLLCTPRAGVTIDGPAHVRTGLNTTTYRAQTDEAGRFSLAAAPAPQDLIAIHDQGYAQLSLAAFEAAGSIALQPWGRVEGSLVLDSQPVSGERIVAYNQVCRYDEHGRRFALMTLSLETKTDSVGRFSFEKVPAGECRIFRQKVLSREIRAGFESHETSVVISAGTATQVALGGTGRPIIGNALLPGATGVIDWQSVPVNLRLTTAYEPGLRPKREDFASNEPFIQAMDRWVEAIRAQQRFGAFCDRNGSFRLPDIPAGTYELKIEIRDYKLDSVSPHDLSDAAPVIASVVREVIVPEISGGQGAEALDLGTLELVPKRDSAPAQ